MRNRGSEVAMSHWRMIETSRAVCGVLKSMMGSRMSILYPLTTSNEYQQICGPVRAFAKREEVSKVLKVIAS